MLESQRNVHILHTDVEEGSYLLYTKKMGSAYKYILIVLLFATY